MQLERKVELMSRYDFGEQRINFSYSGFGAVRTGLIGALSILEELGYEQDESWRQKRIDRIHQAYEYMRMKYDTIDFEELEREIDTEEDRKDFAALFKTREMLPQLGAALDRFIRYAIQNGFKIEPDSPEYMDALNFAKELIEADKPSYNQRLWELEEQLKVQQQETPQQNQ